MAPSAACYGNIARVFNVASYAPVLALMRDTRLYPEPLNRRSGPVTQRASSALSPCPFCIEFRPYARARRVPTWRPGAQSAAAVILQRQ